MERVGEALSTACWTSRWRAKTTSGSPECRKSSIQASAAPSFPRAASRWSVPSWASRSARSVAAIFALSSRRSSGCERSQLDHVLLGEPVLRFVRRARPARRPAAWREAGAGPRTSAGGRSSGAADASAVAPRSAAPWNCCENRAPEPNSSSRPITRSCAISSSAWLSTGVPVSASCSPSGAIDAASAPHRLGALRLRVLAVVRLVDDERAGRGGRARRGGRDDLVVEDRDVGPRRHGAAALRRRATERCGSQRAASRCHPSFIDAGHMTTAGKAPSASSVASASTVLPSPCSSARNARARRARSARRPTGTARACRRAPRRRSCDRLRLAWRASGGSRQRGVALGEQPREHLVGRPASPATS